MRIFLLLVIVGLLAACSPDPTSGQVARVIVRSGGAVDTVYELGADGRAASSRSQSDFSGEVRRTYSYDAAGRLSSVSRVDAAGRSSTVALNPAAGTRADGRVSAASKSLRAAGAETGLRTDYYYTDEGGLDGLMQTDALGNVMSKSSD